MWEYTGGQRPDFAVEPGPGEESVWDYPRPPILDPFAGEVRVAQDRLELARTRRALRLLETASPPAFYLPPDDIDQTALVQVPDFTTWCEWKGAATYWALATRPDAPVGWSYPTPNTRYAALRDWLSFYPSRIECYVAGERAQGQAGGFYGGWVTRNIVGPYKGEPGRGHW